MHTSRIIRIIATIVMTAFIFTQSGVAYALRQQTTQGKATVSLGDDIAKAGGNSQRVAVAKSVGFGTVENDIRENKRAEHRIATVGITVVDLILNKKWDELPDWLLKKLKRDSLVVEGDITGTVDTNGQLTERYLRENLTEEERDRLFAEVIGGGPAYSTVRVWGQITRDGKSRGLFVSSANYDAITTKTLMPDLTSSTVRADVSHVARSEQRTAKTLIFEEGDGRRSFLHNVGASADLTIETFKQAVESGAFDDREVIEFGGVELSGLMDNLADAIKLLRTRGDEIGKRFIIVLDTVVDPAHKWKELFKSSDYDIFKEIDILLTNMDEGGQIYADALFDTPEDAKDGAKICTADDIIDFFASKGAKAIFLKMGKLGSVVRTFEDSVFGQETYRHIPVLKGLTDLSGTGTGDAYSAAAIYGIAFGWDPVKTALFGTVLGGLCLENKGGTLGDKGFVEARERMEDLIAQPEVQASLNDQVSVQESINKAKFAGIPFDIEILNFNTHYNALANVDLAVEAIEREIEDAGERAMACQRVIEMAMGKFKVEPFSMQETVLLMFTASAHAIELIDEKTREALEEKITAGRKELNGVLRSGEAAIDKEKLSDRGRKLFNLIEDLLNVQSGVQALQSEQTTDSMVSTINSFLPAVRRIKEAIRNLNITIGQSITWPLPGDWPGFSDALTGNFKSGDSVRKGVFKKALSQYEEAVRVALPVIKSELERETQARAVGADAEVKANSNGKLLSSEEARPIIDKFNKFETGFEANIENCEVVLNITGRINKTFILTDRNSNKKYIIQKLGTFFDPAAIMQNLILLRDAEEQARTAGHFGKGLPLELWQTVRYYDVKTTDGQQRKHLAMPNGDTWRLMEFVEGESFDSLEKMLERFTDKRDIIIQEAARALRNFRIITSFFANSDSTNEPLPSYHATLEHVEEVETLLEGKEANVLPSRRDTLRKARMIPELLTDPKYAVYRERTERMKYLFGELSLLAAKYIGQKDIEIEALLTPRMAHNDPKFNNMIWGIDEKTGNPYVRCLIDLDTIQQEAGVEFIDFADLARCLINPVGENPWESGNSLDEVTVSIDTLDNFINGYLEGYSEQEIALLKPHLHWAVAQIAFELGTRFFKAYISEELDGSNRHGVYFGIGQEDPIDKNLRLAEVQYKIALLMIRQYQHELGLTESLGFVNDPIGWGKTTAAAIGTDELAEIAGQKTVLVIDENTERREAIVKFLTEVMGFKAEAVHTVINFQTLRSNYKGKPDLIINNNPDGTAVFNPITVLGLSISLKDMINIPDLSPENTNKVREWLLGTQV